MPVWFGSIPIGFRRMFWLRSIEISGDLTETSLLKFLDTILPHRIQRILRGEFGECDQAIAQRCVIKCKQTMPSQQRT